MAASRRRRSAGGGGKPWRRVIGLHVVPAAPGGHHTVMNTSVGAPDCLNGASHVGGGHPLNGARR